MKKNYDFAILGAGPGGYVAAIRAAQLGASVCVIENRDVGGTCLNRGCIPTKAMYKSAEVLSCSKKFAEYGLEGTEAKINIKEVQNRKNTIINNLKNGVLGLFDANKVTYINATASFEDSKKLKVIFSSGEEQYIDAKNIIIATGSKPFMPNIEGANLPGVLTTDELLEIDYIPKRLGVIGAGTVGTEFANIFNSFGSDVYVIIKYDRVMRKLDLETVYKFMKPLKKSGINFVEEVLIDKIVKSENGLIVIAHNKSDGEQVFVEVDNVLVSAGRRPNIKNLNLEKAGIKYSDSGINVDENYKTNIDGVYAIGDVIGGAMLAHVASNEGERLVEALINKTEVEPMGTYPDCVFSFPEMATVGFTEEQVKDKKIKYKVGTFDFASNGKAMTLGETDGMVKIIAGEDDQILGVHIVGPHASDLIHEACCAIENKISVSSLIKTIHAHPTLAETFWEAAMDVHNRSIHKIPEECILNNKLKTVENILPKQTDEKKSEVIKDDNKDELIIKMPKLSDLSSENTLQEWKKSIGDNIEVGEIICVIEAGKTTQQYKSEIKGIMSQIYAEEGDNIKVGEPICKLK